MGKSKVLLVEDAQDMQLMVKAAIGSFCDLTCVSDIAAADKEVRNGGYSLLLLDVNLPDGDGFAFCKSLRSETVFSEMPIIFLTGHTELASRVLGFELGADDYVTKPLEPVEFAARVAAKLKRAKRFTTAFHVGEIRIDLASQKAFVTKDEGAETPLNLTPIEFKLLSHFVQNEGEVFSRDDLLKVVWGDAVHVSGHTVDTHISSLRKKIGTIGSCLKTVVKKGYSFSLPPAKKNI